MEIAINNNDLTKFEKEWSQFLPLVNSIDALLSAQKHCFMTL